MARIESDPNYTAPTFSRATAGTDLFKKEDVQGLASAVSTHDHTSGKGLPLAAGAIPNGTITSAMIADGTIVAGDIADGAVTSAKILDGTIATADHAAASITNALLAADTSRASLLTNGGFEIWQRGGGPFTGNSTYNADRWQNMANAGDTISVVFDGANNEPGGYACAAITYTKSTGGGGLLQHTGSNADLTFQLRGRTVTFSARVRTSVANGARLALNDLAGSPTYGAYHPGSGTYQTISVTRTISPSTSYVHVMLDLQASGTFYIDSAMLVVGSVAADYAPLHPADDLARCLRYYEIVGETAGEINFQGYNAASSGSVQYIPYKVRKAVTPTTTKQGSWPTAINCSQPTVAANGVGGMSMGVTVTALGGFALNNGAASCYFLAEANP